MRNQLKYAVITFVVFVLARSPFAGGMGEPVSPSTGWFAGLGGSYNSVTLNDQKIWGRGIAKTYVGSVLTNIGTAAGYSSPYSITDSIFAPQVQIGFSKHFLTERQFWGIKFLYQYLGVNSINDGTTIAQSGFYEGDHSNTFTGQYVIETVQTKTKHEMILLAFIGQAFKNSKAYVGLGPAVFQVDPNIYNITGLAQIDGTTTDISGLPVNFTGSLWNWGGAVQLGMTYAIDPSWFLDFNYTYALTARSTKDYKAPFNNPGALSHIGLSLIRPTQNVYIGSFSITINKVFAYV